MTFTPLILYVIASYIFPSEIFPALAPYRLTYWIGMVGLVISVPSLLRRSTPLATRELWLLLGLALTLGISRMVADRWPGAPLAVFRLFGPSLTIFVVTVCAVTSLRKLRIVAICVIALSLLLMMQGAAAYHLGYRAETFLFDPVTRAENAVPASEQEALAPGQDEPEDVESSSEGGQDLENRIRGLGLFHDPNDLALGFVMALPLFLAVSSRRSVFRNLVFVVLPGLALCYGVYLTHSRGGALALLATLSIAAARRFGRLTAIPVVLVVGVGIVALDFSGGRSMAGADESIAGRFEAWTEGLEMLKSNPLLGIGYGQFLDYHTKTAHNSFVLCFAEGGIVGYFFWLGLLVSTFMNLRQLRRLSGQEPIDAELKRWATALQLSLVGFVTAGFFLSRTFVPMLYLILGLAVALTLIAREAGRRAWSPSLPTFGTLVVASEFATVLLVYVAVKLRLG